MTGGAGETLLCLECSSEIPAERLSCPICRRLVHSDQLKELAAEAQAAERRGEIRSALAVWRAVLDLIPPYSKQHRQVTARIDGLSRTIDSAWTPDADESRAEGRRSRLGAVGAGVSGAALVIWKLKFVLGFLVTKGKLLLLGLTKTSTMFSMLLSFAAYWSLWGWRFALGLVLSIYVHEMGHVFALRHLGIRASAPMFIPGLGAMVRMRQYPASAREDARVGLAGPLWGLGAAAVTSGIYLATGWASLAAIAQVGAWINLFNLLPLGPLDGGRAFRALGRRGRWLAVTAMGVMWFLTAESLLLLLLVVGAVRATAGATPGGSDRRALSEYLILIVALSGLSALPVPGVTR